MHNRTSVYLYGAKDPAEVVINASKGTAWGCPAYWVLNVGSVTMMLSASQLRRIKVAIEGLALEEKPEPECECRMSGDTADASDCAAHGADASHVSAIPMVADPNQPDEVTF